MDKDKASSTDLENDQPSNRHLSASNPQDPNHNESENVRYRLPFRQWISERFDWSWFTCTQSTGGIAITISECPQKFPAQQTLGSIVFLFNIFLFLVFCACMILRWKTKPGAVKECFVRPPECYFFGSFWLSLATMVLNLERYAVPHTGEWMVGMIRVLFWIYAAVSLVSATVHMVVIAKHVPFKALAFPPAAFILILNAMLTGTVAGGIAMSQPPAQRVPIMVAGVAYQGLGWLMCMIFLTLTFASVLQNGYPPKNLRTGLFIMVGTMGFTIVALIGCARAAPVGYGFFATHPMAAEVLIVVAVWAGVFLWLFCLFTFGFAFLIVILGLFEKKDERWKLDMSWHNASWATIFPNVGWTISTIYLGQELESPAVIWVSVAMVLALVAMWLLDLFLLAKASIRSIFVDSRIKVS